MKRIVKLIIFIFFKGCVNFKINSKKIVFGENKGMGMTGNSYEIYKKLSSQKYKLIFLGMNSKKIKVDGNLVKKYSIFSLSGIYHLATSKYWFSDSSFFSFIKPRKGQINIQLWHAAGAFKKFGLSIESNKKYYIDLLTVSSDTIIDIYQEAFGIEKTKIKNLGIPRADIFFREEEKQKIKEEFYKNYSELRNKKIILYAPTFRENEKDRFNLKLDIELMKENLEGLNYILLLKLHPGTKSKDIQVDNKFSYNFSDYSNTADLLIISDILISDYSSIIFEFSIMKKPILFYAYDVEEYIRDRGFYYNYYDFIPNKISYTTEEIIKVVINQEWDLERIEKFARYFFNPFDGNSTERVLKEVGLWEENK